MDVDLDSPPLYPVSATVSCYSWCLSEEHEPQGKEKVIQKIKGKKRHLKLVFNLFQPKQQKIKSCYQAHLLIFLNRKIIQNFYSQQLSTITTG